MHLRKFDIMQIFLVIIKNNYDIIFIPGVGSFNKASEILLNSEYSIFLNNINKSKIFVFVWYAIICLKWKWKWFNKRSQFYWGIYR